MGKKIKYDLMNGKYASRDNLFTMSLKKLSCVVEIKDDEFNEFILHDVFLFFNV
jgi:hypothetical protein